jgi:hypothetical protein
LLRRPRGVFAELRPPRRENGGGLPGVPGEGKDMEVVLLRLCIPPLRDTVVLVAQDLAPSFFELLGQRHLGRPETDLL